MPGSTCMEQEASVGTEIRVDTVSFDLMHVALLLCRRSSLSIEIDKCVYLVAEIHRMQANLH